MKFEKTVSQLMTRYPTMFGRRERLLLYLFTISGTGYSWYRGQMVTPYDDYRPSDYPKNSEEAQREIEAIHESRTKPVEYISHFYNNSPICMVPDNVKPDWLAGARETLEFILSLDPDVSAGTIHARQREEMFKGIPREVRQAFSNELRQILIDTAHDPVKEAERLARPEPEYPKNSVWQKEARRIQEELKRRFG